MEKEIILSGKGLSIGYETHCVHQGLEFSLRSGELTSLLGPNGAGKSTLMRTIAALQPPLEGSLSLFGKEQNQYDVRERSRLIGVVLTDKAQIGGLTVSELVALGRQPHTGFFGRLRKEDKALVDSAIRSVGLGEKRNSFMAELSDGERQKAMIAKALVQECPLILLDEPTAFLDAASRIEITQLLHEIASTQQRAILLSTHDIELALTLSDRLWLLTKGGLACGTPEDLVLNHQLDTLFSNPKVTFDYRSGQFTPKRDFSRKVFAQAEDEHLRHWVWNALHRMGFGEGTKEDSSAKITVLSKNQILINNNREEATAHSFEEMTDFLNRL